jgi:hydroxypyruvate reductase
MAVKTNFRSHVNQPSPLREAARTIFDEALAACSVESAMRSKIQSHEGTLTLHGSPDETPVEIDLTGVRHVVVIAAGKAATTMLRSLLKIIPLAEDWAISGVLIAQERPVDLPAGFIFFAGGHPLPSQESFAGAQAALKLVRESAARVTDEPAFCFFLLSGGASAMMELPLEAAITLGDTIAFHRALVHSGAPIAEMNCVRKHFSAVKGGRLGAAAATMPSVTLAVSDVPAGRLDVLASGPTLPDPTAVTECREILSRYGLLEQFPASVRAFFTADFAETPKPGAFAARAVTLLSDRDLAEAARRTAETLGFFVMVEDECDNWDYKRAADFLLARLEHLRMQHGRICLISPGELTVQVPSNVSVGIGGRNQHFALYAATLLEAESRPTAILSAGSDGIDGNSVFAGAVIDEHTLREPGRREAALDSLLRFDAATFLSGLGATIETGPTGHNLRDLRLLLSE